MLSGMSGHLKRLKRFHEYGDTVARLFPTLPWQGSISKVDALILGLFFECYPRKAVVLDIGTFAGMSAFFFATQPKVLRVISVDPNRLVADEINDLSELAGLSIDTEPFRYLRVLDLAQAALAEFADEQQKIQLCVGIVGNRQVSVHGGSLDSLEKVEVPVLEPSDAVSLVAFVDGLHTKEGVRADLEAIFERNPHAIVFLHDCRGYWGPFVQAGVVSFMEASRQEYRFHLFEHLGPGLGAPNLGIVYPDTDAVEVKRFLLELQDPLQLLKLVLTFWVLAIPRKLRRNLQRALAQ
jgi:hypothetical protein